MILIFVKAGVVCGLASPASYNKRLILSLLNSLSNLEALNVFETMRFVPSVLFQYSHVAIYSVFHHHHTQDPTTCPHRRQNQPYS